MNKEEKNDSNNTQKEQTAEKLKAGWEEVNKLVSQVKKKYSQSDKETKKKINIAVAGAAALLAGVIGAKAIKRKKKK